MEILIVSSSFPEIQPLVSEMELVSNLETNYARFRFQERELDVLVAGVGTGMVACRVTRALKEKRYDKVLNVGYCASFRSNPMVGTVVNVLDDQFGDVGMEDANGFTSSFEMGVVSDNEFPFNGGVLENNESIPHCLANLPRVAGVTLNTLIGWSGRIQEVFDYFEADVVSQDGAAVSYACLWEKVPCFQIRVVHSMLGYSDQSKSPEESHALPLCDTLKNILVHWFTESIVVLNE